MRTAAVGDGELPVICDDEALELLEVVVVVAGSHWRSVGSWVVGPAPWGDNDDQ